MNYNEEYDISYFGYHYNIVYIYFPRIDEMLQARIIKGNRYTSSFKII